MTMTLTEYMDENMESDFVSWIDLPLNVMVKQIIKTKWTLVKAEATLNIRHHMIMPSLFRCTIQANDYWKTSGHFHISIDDFFAAEKDPSLIPDINGIELSQENKQQIVNGIRQFIDEGSK